MRGGVGESDSVDFNSTAHSDSALNPRKKAKKEKILTPDALSRCECVLARPMKLPELFSVICADLHVESCSTLKLQPLTNNTYENSYLV
jgi:hypothetical protein